MGKIYFCESSGTTLYEWGKKEDRNDAVFIDHSLSEMDTILDLKKKMVRHIKGLSGEISEYLVWFNEKDSPFKGIAVDNFLRNVDVFRDDKTYLGDFWGKKHIVYVTLLKLLPKEFKDGLLSRVGRLSSGIYSRESVDKNIGIQDSIELPGDSVRYENDILFKMIFVDVVPSDGREWVNLDKIFSVFPLSEKIPFMIIEKDGEIKRKVYRKMLDIEQVTKWSKLPREANDGGRIKDILKGIHGLSFKYKYVVSSIIFYLTVKIYPKGGVNVFYRTEHKSENLTKKDWDNVLKLIQRDIIDKVNVFSISNAANIRKTLRSIKESDMIIRTLTTIRKFEDSESKNSKNLPMSFGSFLRTKGLYYRVTSSKKKGDSQQLVQFIRVKDYLSPDNILFVKEQLEIENRNDIIGHMAMLYMTTNKAIEEMITNAELDRREKRGSQLRVKGPLIQFNIKTGELTFVGVHGFSDTEYMYNVFARTYWAYMNGELEDSVKIYNNEFGEKEGELSDEVLFSDDEGEDWEADDWDADDWDADDWDDSSQKSQKSQKSQDISDRGSRRSPDTPGRNNQVKKTVFNVDHLKSWSQDGSYRLERLKAFAPEVFKYKYVTNNKAVGFSNRCQPPELAHPIVVDPDTMLSINKGKYKGSYTDSLEYLGNWYLASEYFCWACMIPLSESDVGGANKSDESKFCPECKGKIVTKKVLKTRNASKKEYTVFKNKNDKEYRPYLDQKLHHPDNLLPICRYKYKMEERKKIKERHAKHDRHRPRISKTNLSLYVKKETSFPLNVGFFGSFNDTIHRLMNNPRAIFKNSANSGNLKPLITAFLRRGIEIKSDQKTRRSFLELVSYYYGASSDETLKIVKDNLKKTGIFLSLYKGGGVRIFEKEFEREDEEDLLKDWLKNKEDSKLNKIKNDSYKLRIFKAMASLIRMLDDPNIEISHTLFWGLFCHPGILFKDGLNVYILEKRGNDIMYVCDQGNCYFPGAKSVFVYLSEENELSKDSDNVVKHYEPVVLVSTGEKGGILHGYPRSIFSDDDSIRDIVDNLRSSCVVIENERYVNYLTKEGYLKNVNNMDDVISKSDIILKRDDITRTAKSYCKIKGRVIDHDINVDHILLESNTLIPVSQEYNGSLSQLKDNLPIFSREVVKIPDYITTMNTLNVFKDKGGLMETMVVGYTTDKTTDELNGLVLKTNRTIPVNKGDDNNWREFFEKKGITYDPRPFYFNLEDTRSIKNQNLKLGIAGNKQHDEYWRLYNEFCFQLGQSLQ